MPAAGTTFVALHVDTSGPDPDRDAIVAIHAVRYVRTAPEDTLHLDLLQAVDAPERRTPTADGHPLHEALEELEQFVGRDPLVGYGLKDGLHILRRHGAMGRAGGIDVAELADVLDVRARDASLDALLGIFCHADRAPTPDDDPSSVGTLSSPAAEAGRLYLALCDAARRVAPDVLEAIVAVGEHASWPLVSVFRAAADDPDSDVEPTKAPAPPPSLRSLPTLTPINVDALDALIAPDGRLASEMPGFEDRCGQRDMLRAVSDAFNMGDQLLVEAGTGTGKSLAYLLPAAAFALANGRHVVVATHTIALQDQLLHNDLPVVRRLLGEALAYAVLKGRGNYLCRTRVAGLHARQQWDIDDTPVVARILVWASTTDTGDRVELRLRPNETRIWRTVHADADVCTSETCSFAAVGSCWVHLARARAAAAHVIVVSHALLVSDARINNRLLPPYEHLVIDEAHHLESVATDAMGFSVTRQRARQALGSRALSGNGGLLARVATSTAASDVGDEVRAAVWESVAELRKLAKHAALDADQIFDAATAFLDAVDASSGAQVRLTDTSRHRQEWFPVEAAWDDLHAHATELRKGIVRLAQALTAADLFVDDGAALVGDLQAAAREIADIDAGLERAIVRPVANDIVWATRQDETRIGVHRAPLVVGETLDRWLFDSTDSLILTSATLQTGGGFDFLRERLALPDAPELVVESPFDFRRSTLLFTPTDLPPPGTPGYQDGLDTALVTLASALGGRVLVLFTSHHGLRTTYHNIRAPLGTVGVRTLGQGLDGPRHAILERFRDTSEPAVLLGTRSFWEGIDVPGDALSGLVIARLPFEVPSDPVFAARSETFEDPFREYAVPLAVLRFRQGFGRLVRTQTDKGVVAVLDSRVLSKSYGHMFLSALPPCQQQRCALSELATAARRFLDGEPLE